MSLQAANNSSTALEQTEIPPELFLPFRGLRDVPLFFSDYCRKLTTHKGVTITRVLICSAEHFYLCHPNGDILRCFPFTSISKILHDEQRNQVGIVVPCEFDVAVETPFSFQLIHVIDVLRRMHGAKIPLEMIRVEAVPRPKGLLGFRSDGTLIWDKKESDRISRKRSKKQRSCTEKALDLCGLREFWNIFKDGCYRYYRRAMRSLDLGIEDDDEVLTTTTAMTLAQQQQEEQQKDGMDAMMLAVGRRMSTGPGGGGSRKQSFILSSTVSSNAATISSSSTSASAAAATSKDETNSESGENIIDDAPIGYRWFRPIEQKPGESGTDNKKKSEQENRLARANAQHFSQDDEVLNLLLSPMLSDQNQQNDQQQDEVGTPRRGGNLSSKNNENEWWPGCQVGYPDGPYALSLAKPPGFKVALDQKNSEFV